MAAASALAFAACSGAAALVGVAACGPSFQAIYEGDARFEHCYAVDENPSAPMAAKADCWKDWVQRYTYGQTRDRVDYATARSAALNRAPMLPTDEAMMNAAPGEGRARAAAPAPTSAFAPPPKTLSEQPDGAPGLDAGDAGDASATSTGARASAPDAAWLNTAAAAPSDRGVGVTGGEAPPGPPSLAACLQACGVAWTACEGVACADGGAKSDRCTACERKYRACVRVCAK